jgi:hypothetical protein
MLIVPVVLVCIPTRGVADERYVDKAHGFSVELPSRWVSVSPDVITQLNTAIARFLRQNISYLTCFVPKGRTSAELPRVLIQFQPWDAGVPTFEALEEGLQQELPSAINKVREDSSLPLRSLELGEFNLDRREKRILMRMQASVPGEGVVHGLSIGMLGKQGVVFLHCYAKEDKFTRTVPVFEVMADSFRFDAGKAYDPAEATVTSIPKRSSERRSGFSWLSSARGGFIGAIVGGGIGAIALVARVLRRRTL